MKALATMVQRNLTVSELTSLIKEGQCCQAKEVRQFPSLPQTAGRIQSWSGNSQNNPSYSLLNSQMAMQQLPPQLPGNVNIHSSLHEQAFQRRRHTTGADSYQVLEVPSLLDGPNIQHQQQLMLEYQLASQQMAQQQLFQQQITQQQMAQQQMLQPQMAQQQMMPLTFPSSMTTPRAHNNTRQN